MCHLSGHIAEKFNSLFTLFTRLNVFFNSSTSCMQCVRHHLKPFTFEFVTVSCISLNVRSLLTGIIFGRYSWPNTNINTETSGTDFSLRWPSLSSLQMTDSSFQLVFFWPPLRFKQYCPSPVIYFRSWSCYTPSIRVRRCAVPVTAVKCTIFWKKSLLSLVQPPPPWQRAAQDNHNTIQLILVHNTQRCSFSLILQWLHSFSR